MKIPVNIKYGEINCLSETCPFQKECANHESADVFRAEDGFTPELTKTGDDIDCATRSEKVLRSVTYTTLPENYDSLGRGYLVIENGQIVLSSSLFED